MTKKKVVIITAIFIAAIVVAGYAFYWYAHKSNPDHFSDPSDPSTSSVTSEESTDSKNENQKQELYGVDLIKYNIPDNYKKAPGPNGDVSTDSYVNKYAKNQELVVTVMETYEGDKDVYTPETLKKKMAGTDTEELTIDGETGYVKEHPDTVLAATAHDDYWVTVEISYKGEKQKEFAYKDLRKIAESIRFK